MFKIYEEPESPNEGDWLRYMMNQNVGFVKICDEPETPMRGCVQHSTTTTTAVAATTTTSTFHSHAAGGDSVGVKLCPHFASV